MASLLLAATPAAVSAQTAGPASNPVSELVVVAASPLPGSNLERDKAPVETYVVTARDISRTGPPDLLNALNQQVGGVNLDSAAGNPYQPTLFYHGFEASPLQGTSEGLAVYANGVRLNQSFGDTVNWDLIPNLAIDRLTVEGSNPVFGLNALGGSLNVQLKTGFTYQGGEADLSGGSFGQVQGDVQYGAKVGNTALYVAISGLHEDGWRDLQSSDIQSLYGDLGWRGERAEAHLNVTLANSVLNGPGTSPVELLAADPAAQFTAPNKVSNRFAQISGSGGYQLSPTTSVQGVVYYDNFRQLVVNGNSANDTPCDDGSGLLCGDSGPSTTLGGATIPAFLGDSPFAYSELDDQTTNTDGYGVSAQVVNTDKLFGLTNHAVLGASYDGAQTDFSGISFIGGITAVSREFVGPGVVIDEPGDNVPVHVGVTDNYYGVFGSDTLNLTPELSVTASARYNVADIDLKDMNGGDLTGAHSYSRFNPAIGLAYKAASWVTLYGGYAEANRAPTPAELSCASPADSCSLANFFVGDPDLKQVVAHTFEAGAHGGFQPFAGATLSYNLALYRTDLDNDILFVNSVTQGRAFFTNVGRTRRQGVDAGARLVTDRWQAYVDYAHTDATYRTSFVESGGSNPAADGDGNLAIQTGNKLPGIPADQVKLGFDIKATERLTLGAMAVGQSGTFLFGDEANLTPKLPGFFVLNFYGSYQVTHNLQVFGRIENVADTRYYTYGTFSPTDSVFLSQAPTASNPRSYSPAAPIGGFGGVRFTF
ncbi:TonB-dependent receptor [Phenylobacterium sp.]|uniref:TonB-dependent receptor n=1 Tax=Phenylobacterium sp. TaxID=1871053 RepID=UPI00120027AE|nr:TonB-dependent receptor [Phenylobacterium sp.]THD61851.1 MAG: hypothetical protein E8A49_09030 [Phenylobacterium sp.]